MVASAVIERIVAEEAAPKEMARSKSTCPEASSWPVRMLVGSRTQQIAVTKSLYDRTLIGACLRAAPAYELRET